MKKFILKAILGEDIEEYSKRLIIKYKTCNGKDANDFIIIGNFNNIDLKVTIESTVDSIIHDYYNQLGRNHEEYLKSQEYKEWKITKDTALKIMNQEAADLMLYFNNDLEFNNITEVLGWLKQIQPYTNKIGINISKKEIINKLILHGYKEDENIKENFNEEDKENFARYIIGQCISGLNHIGSIHPICCDFIDNWNKKFY